MVLALRTMPQGGPSAVPLVWVGIGILAIFALAIGIALNETRRARSLQQRNPGSTVWVVHHDRTTRYLLVTDDEVALLRGSGEGTRWPLDELHAVAIGMVPLPRSRAKRVGLIIEAGVDPVLQRYGLVFPRLAGFGASPTRPYAAQKAIAAAKNRPRPTR